MSERNFHTTKFFTENLLAIEMRKIETLMNICLGLSISDLSKVKSINFGMIT